MTVVTGAALPVVLAYQAWSYWVFRKRIAPQHLPVAHEAVPAVAVVTSVADGLADALGPGGVARARAARRLAPGCAPSA